MGCKRDNSKDMPTWKWVGSNAGCRGTSGEPRRPIGLPSAGAAVGDAGGDGDPAADSGRRAFRRACSSGIEAPVTAEARKMGTVKGGGAPAPAQPALAARLMRLSTIAAPSAEACAINKRHVSDVEEPTCQGTAPADGTAGCIKGLRSLDMCSLTY